MPVNPTTGGQGQQGGLTKSKDEYIPAEMNVTVAWAPGKPEQHRDRETHSESKHKHAHKPAQKETESKHAAAETETEEETDGAETEAKTASQTETDSEENGSWTGMVACVCGCLPMMIVCVVRPWRAGLVR